MITHLAFNNFKSWNELRLNAKPITGLFGANSSGKSSILQMLLMLKQTKEETDRTIAIDFGNTKKNVNLGSFNDVTHNHNEKGISWNISWNLDNKLKPEDPTSDRLNYIFETDNLALHARITKENGDIVQDELKYSFVTSNNISCDISMERKEKKYDLHIAGLDYKFLRNKGRPWDLPSPIKSYNFPDQVQTYFQNTAFLSDFVVEYEKLMDSIYYLGPLREYPKREYPWSGSRPIDVGMRGERVVDALIAARAQNEKRHRGPKKHYKQFDEFIASWLEDLGLIHSFSLKEISNSGLYKVLIKKDKLSPETLITDVGFGVSQILPVLVLLYYVPVGSIVLLEQPEIHLHPSVQSGLAEIIINASKTRNIQVIVESHSEHLLRRLQRRTAEGEISNEHIALYFCQHLQGKSFLRALNLDIFGNISNWPDDFFGDYFGEIAATQEASLRRELEEMRKGGKE